MKAEMIFFLENGWLLLIKHTRDYYVLYKSTGRKKKIKMTLTDWIIVLVVTIAAIYIGKKLYNQFKPGNSCGANCGCNTSIDKKTSG
jgi:hypothetical protein